MDNKCQLHIFHFMYKESYKSSAGSMTPHRLQCLIFSGFVLFYFFGGEINQAQNIDNKEKALLGEWLKEGSAGLALTGTVPLSKGDEEQQWAAGMEVFSRSCAGCHQQSGEGLAGSFPPLAGHIGEILNSKKAKNYLIEVVLFGIEGPIQVGNQRYNGMMPGWGNVFDDRQIADVLNYVVNRWGDKGKFPSNKAYISPEDVRKKRLKPMTAHDV
ncbi:c-type cytochrome [Candidatus Methylacidiphilum infernorum]|uniref:c-type cytochrome n=1 Tax=Candidatus Methylacidiphilum infernorum TaxID=511746 RepID=UPI001F5DF0E8|nr:cytochrome c [Candidatus Methylacidiphilum infernorum]